MRLVARPWEGLTIQAAGVVESDRQNKLAAVC